MFSTQSDNCSQFVHIFDIIFSFAAELEEPKIGIWGKGLKEQKKRFLNGWHAAFYISWSWPIGQHVLPFK